MEFIPLITFLERINMNLLEYLDSDEVPYPIVNSDGKVIYLDNKKEGITFCFKATKASEPNNYKTTVYRELDNIDLCKLFVDIRNFSSNVELKTVVYRSELCELYDINMLSDRFQSETRSSNIHIFHDIDTGKQKIPKDSILNDDYLFSNLDLVLPVVDKQFIKNFFDTSLIFDINSKTFTHKGTQNMSDVKNTEIKTASVIDINKQALITATKLEVGGVALDLITQQVAKTIPEAFRPFIIDNVFFKIVVANAINLLMLQTNVEDNRLAIINDAMMTKSYIDMVGSFDLTKILTDILGKLPSDKITTLVGNVQA